MDIDEMNMEPEDEEANWVNIEEEGFGQF